MIVLISTVDRGGGREGGKERELAYVCTCI